MGGKLREGRGEAEGDGALLKKQEFNPAESGEGRRRSHGAVASKGRRGVDAGAAEHSWGGGGHDQRVVSGSKRVAQSGAAWEAGGKGEGRRAREEGWKGGPDARHEDPTVVLVGPNLRFGRKWHL